MEIKEEEMKRLRSIGESYKPLLEHYNRISNNGNKVDQEFYSAFVNHLAHFGEYAPPLDETQDIVNRANAYRDRKGREDGKDYGAQFGLGIVLELALDKIDITSDGRKIKNESRKLDLEIEKMRKAKTIGSALKSRFE